MAIYYVKVGEVYKVSATQRCEVTDANNKPITTCEAGSIASFNASTAKIHLSDDNAVLTCLSEVSGDLSLLTEHTHNSAIHSTVAEKERWTDAANDSSEAKSQVNAHLGQTEIHVTESEKNSWNGHIGDSNAHITSSDKTSWTGHIVDSEAHVTLSDKASWNAAVTDVTNIKTQLNDKAALNSPTFTGTPEAPTAPTGTSNHQIATTMFVHDVVESKQSKNFGTANAVLVTDGSGNITASSTVDVTELSYLNGLTGNIQTQLNEKQSAISGAATTITSNNLTASRALVSDSSGKVSSSDITSTELGYLDGVSSNIQTQLNRRIRFLNYGTKYAFIGSVSGGDGEIFKVGTSTASKTFNVFDDCLVIFQARRASDTNGNYDHEAIDRLKISVNGNDVGWFEVIGLSNTVVQLPFRSGQKVTVEILSGNSNKNSEIIVFATGYAFIS